VLACIGNVLGHLRQEVQWIEHLGSCQICGVEGYVESIATEMVAGIHAAALASGEAPIAPPGAATLGSPLHCITNADPNKFQPANITFDLLPPLERKIRDRQQRHKMQCDLALHALEGWLGEIADVRGFLRG